MAKINRGQGSLGLMVNDPSLYRNADSLLVTMRSLIADVKARPSRYDQREDLLMPAAAARARRLGGRRGLSG